MHPSGQSRNHRRRLRLVFLLLALVSTLFAWPPQSTLASTALRLASTEQVPVHSIFATRYSPLATQSQPATPAPSEVSQGSQQYFAPTAHFLRGAFLDYWKTHGSTPVLGLPITEPIVEDGLAVQYLERARLEYHTEIAGSPANKVLLTRLGATLAEQRGLHFNPQPGGSDTTTSFFFIQTHHNLANAFLAYWQRNGGLAVFGYPISEEFVETNDADGQPYTVQYFERNRLEWHPALKPAFNIQLGLLGVEYARSNNLDPLARVMLPSPLPAAESDLSNDPRLDNLVDADLLPVVQALGHTPQFRWVPAVIIQNKVVVEFTQIQDEGVGGAFIITRNKQRPYLIVIPSQYQGEPVGALASVLAHEATHAYDFTSGVIPQRTGCSIEEELRAYKNGLAAWVVLKGSDALDGSYDPGTFEFDINNSLVGFNNDRTQLGFDLDLSASREYLSKLYGPDCRQ